MGCAAAGTAVPPGATILPVPNMPFAGGAAEVITADGITLQFFAPAGYPPNTQISCRYTAKPKPKAKLKAKAKPEAKADPKAKLAPAAKSTAASPPGVAPAAGADPAAPVAAVPAAGAPAAGAPAAGAPLLEAPVEYDGPPAPNPQQVEARIVWPVEKGLPVLPPQLPKMDGSWEWIRGQNGEVHRVTRKDAGELMQETLRRGGFSTKTNYGPLTQVRYTQLAQMKAGTKIITFGSLPKLATDPKYTMIFEYGAAISAIDKAESMANEKLKPATVSAASAYHAGGGFTSGGRHALEEAFCSQSTLYASLQKAKLLWEAGKLKSGWRNEEPGYEQHIPSDGAILSPFVEIFRGGSDQGYQLHTKTVAVSVVSVAMYNKNRSVRDAPVDAPSDQKKYEEGVKRKMTVMIHGAALLGADSMIIPDVGCGVFGNDPTVCGRICGEALANYQGRFRKVVFTGHQDFYAAAMQGFAAGGEAPEARLSSSGSCPALPAEAHLYVGSCVICNDGLGGSDFLALSVLLDKSHKSHQMKFLHSSCKPRVRDKPQFKNHQVMDLPDITKNASSVLKALDLNGNGFVEKSELKCICALLWDGDLQTDRTAFEKEFEDNFAAWDSDHSGNVNLKQIQSPSKGASKGSGKASGKGSGKGMSLDSVPKSCIDWVQEQAKKKKDVARTGAGPKAKAAPKR